MHGHTNVKKYPTTLGNFCNYWPVEKSWNSKRPKSLCSDSLNVAMSIQVLWNDIEISLTMLHMFCTYIFLFTVYEWL
jgi:hypothetical protein